MKIFFVYIMTNKWHTVLYTGVTAYLENRAVQHKFKLVLGFTKKYNATKMVYAKYYPSAVESIAAEKRIKGWTRAKKIALIEAVNPEWKDILDEQGIVHLDVLRGINEEVALSK